MSAPLLEVHDLFIADPGGKRDDLLAGVELVLEPRDHMLLTGPSGSGKTTLLRVIAGLESARRGTIRIAGVTATEADRHLLAPQERGVGFLFQGGALWPHLSVAKTLAFVMKAGGVARSEIAQRTGELLDAVELAGYDKRMPGTLSGGEAQRLALARALALRPRLLLLDEPLGPLDAELRGALLAMLGRLREEQGFAALHVTHDPQESQSIATRTASLAEIQSPTVAAAAQPATLRANSSEAI